MNEKLELPEQPDSGAVAQRLTQTLEDIGASRAVATDRIFKGGSLAVLGFGSALLVDVLDLGLGIPFWIGISLSLTAFGAGSLWAGLGASHLIRHGRRGSSLWLISLAGLGGSVILNVVSTTLFGAWSHPVLAALSLFAQAACGLFTLALIVLGIITIVRWMLPGPDPAHTEAASESSEPG